MLLLDAALAALAAARTTEVTDNPETELNDDFVFTSAIIGKDDVDDDDDGRGGRTK